METPQLPLARYQPCSTLWWQTSSPYSGSGRCTLASFFGLGCRLAFWHWVVDLAPRAYLSIPTWTTQAATASTKRSTRKRSRSDGNRFDGHSKKDFAREVASFQRPRGHPRLSKAHRKTSTGMGSAPGRHGAGYRRQALPDRHRAAERRDSRKRRRGAAWEITKADAYDLIGPRGRDSAEACGAKCFFHSICAARRNTDAHRYGRAAASPRLSYTCIFVIYVNSVVRYFFTTERTEVTE